MSILKGDNLEEMCKCLLCNKIMPNSLMSEEHYPAKCVGNTDIVKMNLVGVIDGIMSGKDTFDQNIEDLYPNGRTNRSLCKECNRFIGKYDEAYLRFFKADGEPQKVNGFTKKTKINIIKSIYAKFISIPEAKDEDFDFKEFILNYEEECYDGKWRIYFNRRNLSSDIMGFKSLDAGKMDFPEGVCYEFSDEKFIFNLINFPLPKSFKMTDLFEILNKNYTIMDGTDDYGFHAQFVLQTLFKNIK